MDINIPKNWNFCSQCQKYVPKKWIHCEKLGSCVPEKMKISCECFPDLFKKHCGKCKKCVEKIFEHCEKCDTCHPADPQLKFNKIIRRCEF